MSHKHTSAEVKTFEPFYKDFKWNYSFSADHFNIVITNAKSVTDFSLDMFFYPCCCVWNRWMLHWIKRKACAEQLTLLELLSFLVFIPDCEDISVQIISQWQKSLWNNSQSRVHTHKNEKGSRSVSTCTRALWLLPSLHPK